MGATFENIQLRTEKDIHSVVNAITASMLDKGYTICDKDEATYTFALARNDGSDWYAIYSDIIGDLEDSKELLEPLSKALDCDALMVLCFDSDFLLLNLVNASEQLDIVTGVGDFESYGIDSIDDIELWHDKIDAFDEFKSIIESASDDFECAEDVLSDIAEPLVLPIEQSFASLDYLDDLLGNEIKSAQFIYFTK